MAEKFNFEEVLMAAKNGEKLKKCFYLFVVLGERERGRERLAAAT